MIAAQELDPQIDTSQWGSWRWRVSNLYDILTDEGKRVRFRPNAAQLAFLDHMWYFNTILKSRQHGFTTLLGILAVDFAVFVGNWNALLIAHGLREAIEIFRTKIKFPYESLPEGIKDAFPPTTISKTELILENGSAIHVGTSGRSGTYQMIHISEMGKIAARFPDRAKEIVTGAFQAVHSGSYLFVESTAEGRMGAYYDNVALARKNQARFEQHGVKLTPMDFRFHFHPWYADPKNVVDPTNVVIEQATARYFDDLLKFGVPQPRPEQKAWYQKKLDVLGADMKKEHPSHPDEAFESSVEGSYYGKIIQQMRARGRITRVDVQPTMPVNTFWDLGRNNSTVMWFHQFIASEHRFIDYYENHHYGLDHYVMELNKRPYLYGRHFLPHDVENKNLEYNKSRRDRFVELAISEDKLITVPRIDNINDGIALVQAHLPGAWIDEGRCAEGIRHLENYRNEWDDRLGAFKNNPAHTDASNGADALRQWAQGWTPVGSGGFRRRSSGNFRTV